MNGQQRRIVVGVGDQGAAHVLDWVAVIAHRADIVHLVHAFDPPPFATTGWRPPVEQDDLIYAAAVRHAGYAAAGLRRHRPDLVVDDEILRCPPQRGLSAAARDADLIVVGSPHRPGSRSALAQLSRHSRCPILVVGEQAPEILAGHAPVMVMLRDLANDEAAVEAAFAIAAERRCGLTVLRPWQPHRRPGLVVAEHEERAGIERFLSAWRARYPAVVVSARLRLGDAPSVLRRFAGAAPLLILGDGPSAAAPEPALDEVVAESLRLRRAPTLLVPRSPVADRAVSGRSPLAESMPATPL